MTYHLAEKWHEEESYLASFFVARMDLLFCFNFLSTVKSDMEVKVLYLSKPITKGFALF